MSSARELLNIISLVNEDFEEDIEDDIEKEIEREIEEYGNQEDLDENPELMDEYDLLIKRIRKLSYSDSVSYIDNIVKDPKLRFLLSLGFGGEYASISLNCNTMKFDVKELKPTQKEIDLSKSLMWSINGKKSVKPLFDERGTIIAPIVTYNRRFIIDGHHRWSQAYCTNPDFKILSINYDGEVSPVSMLKAVQATIGTNTGKIARSKVHGRDLYKSSRKEIESFIYHNLSKRSEEELKSIVGLRTRNNVINYLTKNCMLLKENNKPIIDSQEREVMPQTNKDPDVFKDLSVGITRI